jgi:dUTP pyrophosphatase
MASANSHRSPLAFVKLRSGAYAPSFATRFAAGLDLRAETATTVPAHGKAVVATGIAFDFPPGYYGRIASRSGLAVHHDIHVAAGVIDQDYTGEVLVLLLNSGTSNFEVVKGARIAQIILERCGLFQPIQCPSTVLNQTNRGSHRFGSSDQFVDNGQLEVRSHPLFIRRAALLPTSSLAESTNWRISPQSNPSSGLLSSE